MRMKTNWENGLYWYAHWSQWQGWKRSPFEFAVERETVRRSSIKFAWKIIASHSKVNIKSVELPLSIEYRKMDEIKRNAAIEATPRYRLHTHTHFQVIRAFGTNSNIDLVQSSSIERRQHNRRTHTVRSHLYYGNGSNLFRHFIFLTVFCSALFRFGYLSHSHLFFTALTPPTHHSLPRALCHLGGFLRFHSLAFNFAWKPPQYRSFGFYYTPCPLFYFRKLLFFDFISTLSPSVRSQILDARLLFFFSSNFFSSFRFSAAAAILVPDKNIIALVPMILVCVCVGLCLFILALRSTCRLLRKLSNHFDWLLFLYGCLAVAAAAAVVMKGKCLNWAQGNDLHNNFANFHIHSECTINYPQFSNIWFMWLSMAFRLHLPFFEPGSHLHFDHILNCNLETKRQNDLRW